MSFPLTAKQSMKKWNDQFPSRFKEVQNYSNTRFVVWRGQITSSNLRYLQSLGYDALHFNPAKPFDNGLCISIYERCFFQDPYVVRLWREMCDFYVIFQSFAMISRANRAATVIQRCYKRVGNRVVAMEPRETVDELLEDDAADGWGDMKLEDFDEEVAHATLERLPAAYAAACNNMVDNWHEGARLEAPASTGGAGNGMTYVEGSTGGDDMELEDFDEEGGTGDDSYGNVPISPRASTGEMLDDTNEVVQPTVVRKRRGASAAAGRWLWEAAVALPATAWPAGGQ